VGPTQGRLTLSSGTSTGSDSAAERPLIFVSHTDRQDSDAEAFRSELYEGLEAAGFDLFLDERSLELGEAWARDIMVRLLGCHAGLILVSERALKPPPAGSAYMQYETTLLVGRRMASQLAQAQGAPEPTFPIIPILIPPVTAESFKGTWLEPTSLDEIQGGAAIGDLVERIATRLAPIKTRLADTPLAALKRTIGPWLRQVPEANLREAARCLGVNPDGWLASALPDLVTAELLKTDIARLPDVMNELAPQLLAHAKQLLEILGTAWVEPDAAARLPPIARCVGGRRVVGINGTRVDFTAPAYVRRAWACFPGPQVVFVTDAGELDAEGVTNEIVAAVQQSEDLSTEEDALDYVHFEARRASFFVAVPWRPERDMIEALSTKFPEVTFLFLSTSVLEEEERVRLGIEYLLPEIKPGREKEAYNFYKSASRVVRDAIAAG
jgi:hypothetical protein